MFDDVCGSSLACAPAVTNDTKQVICLLVSADDHFNQSPIGTKCQIFILIPELLYNYVRDLNGQLNFLYNFESLYSRDVGVVDFGVGVATSDLLTRSVIGDANHSCGL